MIMAAMCTSRSVQRFAEFLRLYAYSALSWHQADDVLPLFWGDGHEGQAVAAPEQGHVLQGRAGFIGTARVKRAGVGILPPISYSGA